MAARITTSRRVSCAISPLNWARPTHCILASAINLDATLVPYDERLAEAARMRGAGVTAP